MNPTLARFAPWLGTPAVRATGGELAVVAFATADDAPLQPCGIGPESIVSGTPQARASMQTQAPDGRFASGMWDCTAGVLNVSYGCDELVHILDGEVTVSHGGRVQRLLPGHVAYFPRGVVARWEIPHYVKKVYVHRTLPRPLVRRVVNKLRRMVGAGG